MSTLSSILMTSNPHTHTFNDKQRGVEEMRVIEVTTPSPYFRVSTSNCLLHFHTVRYDDNLASNTQMSISSPAQDWANLSATSPRISLIKSSSACTLDAQAKEFYSFFTGSKAALLATNSISIKSSDLYNPVANSSNPSNPRSINDQWKGCWKFTSSNRTKFSTMDDPSYCHPEIPEFVYNADGWTDKVTGWTLDHKAHNRRYEGTFNNGVGDYFGITTRATTLDKAKFRADENPESMRYVGIGPHQNPPANTNSTISTTGGVIHNPVIHKEYNYTVGLVQVDHSLYGTGQNKAYYENRVGQLIRTPATGRFANDRGIYLTNRNWGLGSRGIHENTIEPYHKQSIHGFNYAKFGFPSTAEDNRQWEDLRGKEDFGESFSFRRADVAFLISTDRFTPMRTHIDRTTTTNGWSVRMHVQFNNDTGVVLWSYGVPTSLVQIINPMVAPYVYNGFFQTFDDANGVSQNYMPTNWWPDPNPWETIEASTLGDSGADHSTYGLNKMYDFPDKISGAANDPDAYASQNTAGAYDRTQGQVGSRIFCHLVKKRIYVEFRRRSINGHGWVMRSEEIPNFQPTKYYSVMTTFDGSNALNAYKGVKVYIADLISLEDPVELKMSYTVVGCGYVNSTTVPGQATQEWEQVSKYYSRFMVNTVDGYVGVSKNDGLCVDSILMLNSAITPSSASPTIREAMCFISDTAYSILNRFAASQQNGAQHFYYPKQVSGGGLEFEDRLGGGAAATGSNPPSRLIGCYNCAQLTDTISEDYGVRVFELMITNSGHSYSSDNFELRVLEKENADILLMNRLTYKWIMNGSVTYDETKTSGIAWGYTTDNTTSMYWTGPYYGDPRTQPSSLSSAIADPRENDIQSAASGKYPGGGTIPPMENSNYRYADFDGEWFKCLNKGTGRVLAESSTTVGVVEHVADVRANLESGYNRYWKKVRYHDAGTINNEGFFALINRKSGRYLTGSDSALTTEIPGTKILDSQTWIDEPAWRLVANHMVPKPGHASEITAKHTNDESVLLDEWKTGDSAHAYLGDMKWNYRGYKNPIAIMISASNPASSDGWSFIRCKVDDKIYGQDLSANQGQGYDTTADNAANGWGVTSVNSLVVGRGYKITDQGGSCTCRNGKCQVHNTDWSLVGWTGQYPAGSHYFVATSTGTTGTGTAETYLGYPGTKDIYQVSATVSDIWHYPHLTLERQAVSQNVTVHLDWGHQSGGTDVDLLMDRWDPARRRWKRCHEFIDFGTNPGRQMTATITETPLDRIRFMATLRNLVTIHRVLIDDVSIWQGTSIDVSTACPPDRLQWTPQGHYHAYQDVLAYSFDSNGDLLITTNTTNDPHPNTSLSVGDKPPIKINGAAATAMGFTPEAPPIPYVNASTNFTRLYLYLTSHENTDKQIVDTTKSTIQEGSGGTLVRVNLVTAENPVGSEVVVLYDQPYYSHAFTNRFYNPFPEQVYIGLANTTDGHYNNNPHSSDLSYYIDGDIGPEQFSLMLEGYAQHHLPGTENASLDKSSVHVYFQFRLPSLTTASFDPQIQFRASDGRRFRPSHPHSTQYIRSVDPVFPDSSGDYQVKFLNDDTDGAAATLDPTKGFAQKFAAFQSATGTAGTLQTPSRRGQRFVSPIVCYPKPEDYFFDFTDSKYRADEENTVAAMAFDGFGATIRADGAGKGGYTSRVAQTFSHASAGSGWNIYDFNISVFTVPRIEVLWDYVQTDIDASTPFNNRNNIRQAMIPWITHAEKGHWENWRFYCLPNKKYDDVPAKTVYDNTDISSNYSTNSWVYASNPQITVRFVGLGKMREYSTSGLADATAILDWLVATCPLHYVESGYEPAIGDTNLNTTTHPTTQYYNPSARLYGFPTMDYNLHIAGFPTRKNATIIEHNDPNIPNALVLPPEDHHLMIMPEMEGLFSRDFDNWTGQPIGVLTHLDCRKNIKRDIINLGDTDSTTTFAIGDEILMQGHYLTKKHSAYTTISGQLIPTGFVQIGNASAILQFSYHPSLDEVHYTTDRYVGQTDGMQIWRKVRDIERAPENSLTGVYNSVTEALSSFWPNVENIYLGTDNANFSQDPSMSSTSHTHLIPFGNYRGAELSSYLNAFFNESTSLVDLETENIARTAMGDATNWPQLTTTDNLFSFEYAGEGTDARFKIINRSASVGISLPPTSETDAVLIPFGDFGPIWKTIGMIQHPTAFQMARSGRMKSLGVGTQYAAPNVWPTVMDAPTIYATGGQLVNSAPNGFISHNETTTRILIENGPRVEMISARAAITFNDVTDMPLTCSSAHSFNNARPAFLQISGMLTPFVVDHEEKAFDLFAKIVFNNDVATVMCDTISIPTIARPQMQKLIMRLVDENGELCDYRDTISVTLLLNRDKKSQPESSGAIQKRAAPTARRRAPFNPNEMYASGAQFGCSLNY